MISSISFMNEGNGQRNQPGAALMIYDWKRWHACLDNTLLLHEAHLIDMFSFLRERSLAIYTIFFVYDLYIL